VLVGYAEAWKASSAWSLDYLTKLLGDVTVEVLTGRDSDPRFETNSDAHRQTMAFAEYLDWVAETEDSNDRYLSAKNHFLAQEAAGPLWDDFTFNPEYLDADLGDVRQHVHLWLGPKGTLTPLHADAFNGLLVQISGRKRVTLVSALEAHIVHNNIDDHADVDCDDPALAGEPWFQALHRLEVTLGPGEALFIPVGWLHQVRSLDLSISLTFTNFVFGNAYEWRPDGIFPQA
jgi:ribosomal protein L16 Arg81 hydroxylase